MKTSLLYFETEEMLLLLKSYYYYNGAIDLMVRIRRQGSVAPEGRSRCLNHAKYLSLVANMYEYRCCDFH